MAVTPVKAPLTAYNLTVADFETFFVAANDNAEPVWVHNCGNPYGRQSNPATRAQIDSVALEIEATTDYRVTNGAFNRPEEYVKGPNGGRKGSAYPDITMVNEFDPSDVIRINTIDVRADGFTPTLRELNNAGRITDACGRPTCLIPKPP